MHSWLSCGVMGRFDSLRARLAGSRATPRTAAPRGRPSVVGAPGPRRSLAAARRRGAGPEKGLASPAWVRDAIDRGTHRKGATHMRKLLMQSVRSSWPPRSPRLPTRSSSSARGSVHGLARGDAYKFKSDGSSAAMSDGIRLGDPDPDRRGLQGHPGDARVGACFSYGFGQARRGARGRLRPRRRRLLPLLPVRLGVQGTCTTSRRSLRRSCRGWA
ncbi:MAG: hypothetical protein MZU95_05295 [Desulfomicrobium escambiense]|nr:hypothetical protein [Desulfomicrobium escambiense]